MSNVTLLIGLIGAVLVLLMRPLWGFAVYMAVLFFYPIYVVVQLGPLDVYASRIVVTALLARCLLDRSLRRKFKWCSLDTWVMLYFGVTVFVTCITQPPLEALQNRAGIFMDTGFAYIAMRLCITSRAAMVTFIKSIAILLVPLAFLGFLESAYNWRPYGQLRQYCPWRTETTIKPGRLGFERAEGAIGNTALFGATFAMFLPCIWALRHERGSWRTAAYVLSGAAIIGALSSFSSSPWVMVIIIIGCLVLERFKWAVKPVIILIILSLIAVAIISNRPVYHVVVSYADPVGGTGWHRARIIDAAVDHFGEWWFAGYGGRDPGWGDYTGMAFTDVTNHFICDGISYGIWGLIADGCVFAVAIRTLRALHRNSNDYIVKSWAWALGTAIVSIIVFCMSVGLWGQPFTFLYIIFGMVGSSYHFTGDLEQLQYQTLPLQNNISIPPQEAMLRRSWSI